MGSHREPNKERKNRPLFLNYLVQEYIYIWAADALFILLTYYLIEKILKNSVNTHKEKIRAPDRFSAKNKNKNFRSDLAQKGLGSWEFPSGKTGKLLCETDNAPKGCTLHAPADAQGLGERPPRNSYAASANGWERRHLARAIPLVLWYSTCRGSRSRSALGGGRWSLVTAKNTRGML